MSYSNTKDAKGYIEGPDIRTTGITQSLAGYRDTWKLENLLSIFREGKKLPPALSPRLPDAFFGRSPDINEKNNDEPKFSLPETLISPTLPRTFDSAVGAKILGDDNTESNNSIGDIGEVDTPEKNSSTSSAEGSLCQPSGNGSRTKILTKMNNMEAKDKNNSKDTSRFSNLDFKSHASNWFNSPGKPRSSRYNMSEGCTQQQPDRSVSIDDLSEQGKLELDGVAGGSVAKHRKVENTSGKESENSVKEKATIKDQYCLTPDLSTLSHKEVEKYKQQLIKGRDYWSQITEKVRLYSKSEDPIKNVTTLLESFVLHMILCQYDERLQTFSGALDREWKSLLGKGTDLIAYVKERISTQQNQKNSSDHESIIKQYFQAFIGLLYQTNALIIVRINSILKIRIDKYLRERTTHGIDRSSFDFINEQLITLQRNEIDNYNTSVRFFAFARRFFDSLLTFQDLFPNTWENRSCKGISRTKRVSFVPQHDKYFLPIQIDSDVREACALLLHCEQEFTTIYKERMNSKRKPEYDLYSILNNAL